MRVYKTPEIRNVAVVGHGASGKTSLVDALAFVAGTSKRHGSVKDGTALTDYTADEIERKYSINLALAVAEWMDSKINLIDTPGYLDFTGDALAGVYAADAAVVVLSATAGVEVGTEKVWDYCEKRALPRARRLPRATPRLHAQTCGLHSAPCCRRSSTSSRTPRSAPVSRSTMRSRRSSRCWATGMRRGFARFWRTCRICGRRRMPRSHRGIKSPLWL